MLLVLGLLACVSKAEKPDTAAVEKYINTDLNGLIGMLWVGKKPLETIKPDHFDTAHGWFARPSALETIVIPRMDQVLAGAAKITAPEAMKTPAPATRRRGHRIPRRREGALRCGRRRGQGEV